MTIRTRKLIGTVILIVIVIVYAILATAFASAFLAQSHWTLHLAYFAISGLLWVVPAMFLIRWMERGRRS